MKSSLLFKAVLLISLSMDKPLLGKLKSACIFLKQKGLTSKGNLFTRNHYIFFICLKDIISQQVPFPGHFYLFPENCFAGKLLVKPFIC
jgi:hypothetical protein